MAKKSKERRAAERAYRSAEKAAKKNPKAFWATVAVILVIVIVLLIVGYYLYSSGKLNKWLGIGDETGGGTTVAAGALEDITGADLSIHFLELGVANVGDCVLIKSGNTEVLIDAGAKSTRVSKEYLAPTKAMLDYVATYCTDGTLEYVIATHAHEDHIAGLVGQESGTTRTGFLYQYNIGTIIQFSGHNTTSAIYNNYAQAVEYCRGKGTRVYDAIDCTKEENGASKVYYLNDEKTISMSILYQKYYDNKAGTENDYSVCMLLSNKVSETQSYHYLFTGDLEGSGEKSLVENNPDLPHCVLFKGGHHGSSTSSNDILLNKITPENIAICTCAGTYEYADKPDAEHPDNYKNTFPTQEAIDRMSKHTENIYITSLGIVGGAEENYATKGFTSMNGNIVFYYGKGKDETEKSLKLWCSNSSTRLKDTEWFKQNRVWSGVT